MKLTKDELVTALRQYSESLVAYKLGADFADAVWEAADAMENLQTENAALRRATDALTDAQAVMVKEFTAKLEELSEVKAERDAAVEDLSISAYCRTCKRECGLAESLAKRNREGGCKDYEWRGPQKEAQ